VTWATSHQYPLFVVVLNGFFLQNNTHTDRFIWIDIFMSLNYFGLFVSSLGRFKISEWERLPVDEDNNDDDVVVVDPAANWDW